MTGAKRIVPLLQVILLNVIGFGILFFLAGDVDETFLSEAANGEYCFVENKELKPFEKWIEKMIVFRWNRSYPADQTFDIDLSKWQLSEVSEFEGNSHEKITVEVYVK